MTSGDKLAAVRDHLDETLVALDFDGTLAPIVPRPEDARVLDGTAEVLTELSANVRQVAVITGRPSYDVIDADGGLMYVPGLIVLGHYGLDRWEAGSLTAPRPSESLVALRQRMADLAAARPGVELEEKGHSVALHTRNAPDPDGALSELRPLVTAAATEAGFQATPGRFVVEARPLGVDKGMALRSLVAETGARAVLFIGDDTGDLPAVAAVRELEGEGMTGIVVCSDAEEADADLRRSADIVVAGPQGVQDLLRSLIT